MKMKKSLLVALAVAAIPAAATAQFLQRPTTGNRPVADKPPDTELVTTAIAGQDVTLWPYTGENFGEKADPINLVFVGNADPRQIRAALLRVSGDRSARGLPPVFPFNCTWADGAGNSQPVYAGGQWVDGAIQLQCGEYTLMRTHLRLFRFKGFTLAGAHFELMATGTAKHFTMSWDFPEQLVVRDLVDAGLARVVGYTDVINPTPTYQVIEPYIYPAIPAYVKQYAQITSPAKSNGDGRATILELTAPQVVEAGETEVQFVYPYNIPIAPKPFCNPTGHEYVSVSGPLDFVHRVTLNELGEYRWEFEVNGTLSVTPVNPLTGAAIGPTVDATVRQRQHASFTDGMEWGEDVIKQVLHTPVEQALFQKLRVGQPEYYVHDEDCGTPE